MIAQRGRPIPLGDLHREFNARGVVFPGKNPVNTLGARLSNAKDQLVTFPGFGWWLAERPFEAANYRPGTKPTGEQGPPVGASAALV